MKQTAETNKEPHELHLIKLRYNRGCYQKKETLQTLIAFYEKKIETDEKILQLFDEYLQKLEKNNKKKSPR